MSAPANIVGPPSLTATLAATQSQNQQQAANGVTPGAAVTGYILETDPLVIADSVGTPATGPFGYDSGIPIGYDVPNLGYDS